MAGETGKFFPFHNVGLFSDHFLSKRLPGESSVWRSEKEAAGGTLEKVLSRYRNPSPPAKLQTRRKYPTNEELELVEDAAE